MYKVGIFDEMKKFLICYPIYLGVLVALIFTNQLNAAVMKYESIKNGKTPILNVAVIGAGMSGLASAKNALAHGYNVTIFEQSEDLGGIWRYTDQVGKDKYGVNIHTAMYQGLRTNAPYQTMEFPDHPYPNDTPSYPSHTHVFKYLHSYADRFSLKKHMRLNHLVIRVLPLVNDKWEMIVRDLPSNTFKTLIYDAVFVCNGHFASPRYPNIPGINEYKGKLIHSHDFRTANAFNGDNILIIGAGPSGIDLVHQLSKAANRITFSQRKHLNPNEFPSNAEIQGEVKRFTPTGTEFIDGTNQSFSAVILATGYDYSYPFLSIDTGITVKDKSVTPLYKQVFNIEHSTMAFIGIPISVVVSQTQDLQARFALKFISGEKKLPPKEEMLEDMITHMQNQYQRSHNKRRTHYLGPEQKKYYKELAETADIENIPDVLADMHTDSDKDLNEIPSQFRKFKYTVIDDQTFNKERYEN